jgi:pimeloyl-ACP methyl ester carboxylesterase
LPAGDFSVDVAGGQLAGWIAGDGPRVLLLHGGPGLSYGYLDEIAADIGPSFRLAAYQQRGIAPSTTSGPFSVAQEVADVAAVLDGLGWPDSVLVGHSWGGHLALRAAAAHPDRISGVLAIDPLGVAGDGGAAAFSAELTARTPSPGRERLAELEALEADGRITEAEHFEVLTIVWPAYFAHPGHIAPMPPLTLNVAANEGIFATISEGQDEAAESLAAGAMPILMLAGGASPMPWGQASQASAGLSPRGEVEVIPHAGHFVWFEAPGCVRAALERLVSAAR